MVEGESVMTLSDYDWLAFNTAVYPTRHLPGWREGEPPTYPALGLCGEAGEVAEKVKKVIRDDGGVVSEEARTAIILELGDALWYLAAVARDIGSSLEDVAQANIKKLQSRIDRGTLRGSGDGR
jgi:NTP pyrophosphatase (non-canonical NTP hydrolase)